MIAGLGGWLALGQPWVLLALPALPLAWWLLRLIPPSPRLVRFPPARLLLGLNGSEDAAARTPWWILVLRLLIAALVILGLARPVVNPSPPGRGGALALVVDDGWASAHDWDRRQDRLTRAVAEASAQGRDLLLITTAPTADGGPPRIEGPAPAAAIASHIQALTPKPWPVDRLAAARAVAQLPHDRVIETLWLSDGIEDGHAADLAAALQALGGGVTVAEGTPAHALVPSAPPGHQVGVGVIRAKSGADEVLGVRAIDGQGRVLVHERLRLAPGQERADLVLPLPTELRNRLTRVDIEAEAAAASTLLLDQGWRRPRVGLIGGEVAGAPLLSPYYYIQRALAPHADIATGEPAQLMTHPPEVLIAADQVLAATEIRPWVEAGGVLIRFAGPVLARAAQGGGGDPLLPVRLRAGGRVLGGAMSWTTPLALAPFPEATPLSGLNPATDVLVNAQVLAEPEPALTERTWARLADGTPLVTGRALGKGWLVLIHTSANAEWGNLALSGLFVDMLRRLIRLGDGGAPAAGPLAPGEVLDGFGRLHPAAGAVIALPADPDAAPVGPRHPPGLYGPPDARTAFNLGPRLGPLGPMRLPAGLARVPLAAADHQFDLGGPLLAAALVLLALDLLASLSLRGLLRQSGTALGVALAIGIPWGGPSGIPGARAASFDLDAGLATRLAYVRTGDAATDLKSRSGLTALSLVVGQRSTAQMAQPMAVDLERDPVLFFPLLYWPLNEEQAPLSAAARAKLAAYMRAGGLLVIDTGDQAQTRTAGDSLRALTEGLGLPPLAMIGADHVLTRTFYLLKDLPGRWDGPVWAAEFGGDHDGVSPLVVGGNDWAGAWATDSGGRPLYPCVPGGERQRELAWRFGVNLVMYALTGNYKADQVHVPAIMERLGR